MPRALVIDDDATIRAALQRFFARRGWHCDEAENGLAGLERLSGGEAYQVIICDIRMPVMTGAELHDRLRESRPELLDRFLLIAGEVTSPEVARFVDRTDCPILGKPFELRELAEAVERVLGRELREAE